MEHDGYIFLGTSRPVPVAGFGGMGATSSVNLRRLRPDLMAATDCLNKEADALVAGPVCSRLPFGDKSVLSVN
ncbi:MAG: hypothetical protein ACYCZL_01215 [Polaromonas sp.]